MSGRRLEQVERVGNATCLDLVNTFEPHAPDEHAREHLDDEADLAAWLQLTGLVAEADERALVIELTATELLPQTRSLRERLRRLFGAVADGDVPDATDLSELVELHAQLLAGAALEATPDRFRWSFDHPGATLDVRVLGPITASAIELLTSDRVERVKRCPVEAGGCAWLFVDTTKNRSRRWCSMATCGAPAKARRQYERRKAAKRDPG